MGWDGSFKAVVCCFNLYLKLKDFEMSIMKFISRTSASIVVSSMFQANAARQLLRDRRVGLGLKPRQTRVTNFVTFASK